MAIITNDDWNGVQSKVVRVLGTPHPTTNDLGYNTSYSSGVVDDNQPITGAHWNALRSDINKAYALQTGSNSDLTTRGNTQLITAADLTLIGARADTAQSNRGSISTGQLNYIAGPSFSQSFTFSGGFTTIDDTITWANNAAFRGFWNGGGRIVITGSRSGGDPTPQNQTWTNLMANMGSIVLTRTSLFQSGNIWNGGFSSEFPGVYNATNPSAQVLAFSINSPEANYTSNSFLIYLGCNTADIKTMTSLRIQTQWNDGHAGQGSSTGSEKYQNLNANGDVIDATTGGPTGFGPDYGNGTISNSCAIYYPFSETRPNNY